MHSCLRSHNAVISTQEAAAAVHGMQAARPRWHSRAPPPAARARDALPQSPYVRAASRNIRVAECRTCFHAVQRVEVLLSSAHRGRKSGGLRGLGTHEEICSYAVREAACAHVVHNRGRL